MYGRKGVTQTLPTRERREVSGKSDVPAALDPKLNTRLTGFLNHPGQTEDTENSYACRKTISSRRASESTILTELPQFTLYFVGTVYCIG
jgi:hypothetical protein